MRRIILFQILFGIVFVASAQKRNSNSEYKERVRIQHITFITTETNFTSSEAEKFWPIYNEYREGWFKMMRAGRRQQKAFQEKENATDQEYRNEMEMMLKMRADEVAMQTKYYHRMAEVLSPKTMWLFMQAEERFFRDFMRNHGRERKGE